MFLLQIIYMVALIAVAHIIGTEVLGLNPDLGVGSPFDIYMVIVLCVGFFLPITLPKCIDFALSVKNDILAKTNLSNRMATLLAILITVLGPFLVAFAILAAIVGAHMLLSWLLGLIKK